MSKTKLNYAKRIPGLYERLRSSLLTTVCPLLMGPPVADVLLYKSHCARSESNTVVRQSSIKRHSFMQKRRWFWSLTTAILSESGGLLSTCLNLVPAVDKTTGPGQERAIGITPIKTTSKFDLVITDSIML